MSHSRETKRCVQEKIHTADIHVPVITRQKDVRMSRDERGNCWTLTNTSRWALDPMPKLISHGHL